MKTSGCVSIRGVIWLLSALFCGMPVCSFAVEKAKFDAAKIEYRFILNNLTHIDERYMPMMPDQVVERLAPMFIVTPKGKYNNGMYIDTPDRKLQQKNLILRVKKGRLTVNVRGTTPEVLIDLPQCERKKSKKKYNLDYHGERTYSISSSIKFSMEDLDIAGNRITPRKVASFLQGACAPLYEVVKEVLADPAVVIPGTTKQYKFKVSLGEKNSLAGNDDFTINLAIWYFPTTVDTIFELSFTGPASEQEELETLQQQTIAFLQERGMLSGKQISKTQIFFNVYLPGE